VTRLARKTGAIDKRFGRMGFLTARGATRPQPVTESALNPTPYDTLQEDRRGRLYGLGGYQSTGLLFGTVTRFSGRTGVLDRSFGHRGRLNLYREPYVSFSTIVCGTRILTVNGGQPRLYTASGRDMLASQPRNVRRAPAGFMLTRVLAGGAECRGLVVGNRSNTAVPGPVVVRVLRRVTFDTAPRVTLASVARESRNAMVCDPAAFA